MQEILLKIRYFERSLTKSLKEVNFIFSFEPVPSNGQDYKKNKRDLELVTSRSSGYKMLVMHYLTKLDDALHIAPGNLCEPIHSITNYSTFICPIESGKRGKEDRKLQKF